jgi:hypothetical protein
VPARFPAAPYFIAWVCVRSGVHSCPSVCCSLNEALDDEDPIDRNSLKEALPSMAKDIPFGGNYWLLGSTRRKAHGMTVASTALKRRPYRP